MKAYVAKNGNGSVTRGWLLRSGYSIDSPMCRLTRAGGHEKLEEVTVELAVEGAGDRGRRVVPSSESPAAVAAAHK